MNSGDVVYFKNKPPEDWREYYSNKFIGSWHNLIKNKGGFGPYKVGFFIDNDEVLIRANNSIYPIICPLKWIEGKDEFEHNFIQDGF